MLSPGKGTNEGCEASSVSGTVPKSIIIKLDFSNPHFARLVLQTFETVLGFSQYSLI
jgi:hypothetical protein